MPFFFLSTFAVCFIVIRICFIPPFYHTSDFFDNSRYWFLSFLIDVFEGMFLLVAMFEKDVDVFSVSHLGYIHMQFVAWIVLYSSHIDCVFRVHISVNNCVETGIPFDEYSTRCCPAGVGSFFFGILQAFVGSIIRGCESTAHTHRNLLLCQKI